MNTNPSWTNVIWVLLLLVGRIPIGFSLVRYKLHSDGYLGEKKPKKPNKWHARWIKCQVRHAQDALPLNPFEEDPSIAHGQFTFTEVQIDSLV